MQPPTIVVSSSSIAVLVNTVTATVDSQLTRGFLWPDSAEFAVEYRYSTWPLGFHGSVYVKFFDSLVDLDRWLESQRRWDMLEDNDIAMRVWQWDLGPNHLIEYDLLEGHLSCSDVCLSD